MQAMIDGEKFQLAVTNILTNALKYSSLGTVDVDLVTRGEPALREQAGVRIRDRGIGMSPDQMARFFERFYRVNRSSDISGTGLGATIVQEIMTAHKGEIEMSSELGVGTMVVLWLDRLPDRDDEVVPRNSLHVGES